MNTVLTIGDNKKSKNNKKEKERKKIMVFTNRKKTLLWTIGHTRRAMEIRSNTGDGNKTTQSEMNGK
jgi:hypothetical protein